MGAYAEALETFGAHGIQIYPTKPGKPTTALVRPIKKFRARTVDPRFLDANAAFRAGPENNICIIDIDAPGTYHRDMAAEMFGETPYVVETPSGGAHLGYRHSGERRSIRPWGENVPIDLLGGGSVVAPPSSRLASDKKRAGEYRFIGDLDAALANLPAIREGVIPSKLYRGNTTAKSSMPTCGHETLGRNDTMFRWALPVAARCTSETTLLEKMLAENARYDEPMAVDEVQRIAASAWGYKVRGTLFLPGSREGSIGLEELSVLRANLSASFVLTYLRAHHPIEHIFAVSPKGIAKALQMAPNTVRCARDFLLENHFLEEVSALGDPPPRQFRLSQRGVQ